MADSSLEYWKQREREAKAQAIRDADEYNARLREIYKYTADNIERTVNDWYARYATKNHITMADARARVSSLDMKRYEKLAAKYVRERDLSAQANEEMEIYNLTMRINRLELLRAQINLELMAGYDDIEKEMERDLIKTAMKEDRRLAGILGNSVIGNEQYAKELVNASFRNATFSERLWGNNMPALRTHLEAELRNGLIQGIHPRELARRFRQHYGGSVKDTERLMVTEMRRLQTSVQKESFERNGFKEYTFITTGDERVCEDCDALNGQHFKVSEMQPGENAPPMHPSCRCSTAAYMDSDKYKRWIEALANGEDVRWNEFEAGPMDVESYGENPQTDIDYASAYTFSNGDTALINKLLSGRVNQECNAVNEILNGDEYGLPLSHWSKKTHVARMEDMARTLGRKEYNCDITIREDQVYNIKTFIHEDLHSRSISAYAQENRKAIYIANRGIEEGVVEYLSQEICKRNGIPYQESYTVWVNSLRQIKRIVVPRVDDYDFAKELIEVPLDERYNYLVNMALNHVNAATSMKERVLDKLDNNLIELLKSR
ncbi:MAG: minor capsid protein [Lachnospiraceae bacterium]|nr:minor capsid protein [Lachnospiraceae bacterium]